MDEPNQEPTNQTPSIPNGKPTKPILSLVKNSSTPDTSFDQSDSNTLAASTEPNLFTDSAVPTLDSIYATEGGIEFLTKLAETKQIDPANVDVIEVTDRFLRAIAAAPKENLRQSGKVLFHASVLLRLKAEALFERKLNFGTNDDFLEFGADGDLSIYDSEKREIARQITLNDLEKALVRRANNRQNRQRKVTLDQLVNALKEAERIDRIRADRKKQARIQLADYYEVLGVEDILDLAHDEDIEVTIKRVDRILLDKLLIGEAIGLADLVPLLGGRRDWVDAF